MAERLTTLAAVKEWLGIKADQDAVDRGLIRVIKAVSQFMLTTYLNRPGFSPVTYTENFRGNGKDTMLLRNWPVLSVASVGIGSSSIAASVPGTAGNPGAGWRLGDERNAPQSLELFGHSFYYRMPSQVVYRAGYEGSERVEVELNDEGGVVPVAPSEYGQWVSDLGVRAVDGDVFVKVDADPELNEYSVDEWGVYTFSTLNASEDVIIEYGYAPWDVAFAVTEVIGEWYKRKERIGILSKTLGGQETITFSDRDISGPAAAALQGYRNVIPV